MPTYYPYIWPMWVNGVNGGYPPTGSTATTVWINWTATTAQTTSNVVITSPIYQTVPPETPEQQRIRARSQLILNNRTHARMVRQRIASRTAAKLLEECLSEAQRHEWTEQRGFHVETANGRKYWIAHGTSGNVRLVEAGKVAPKSRYGAVIRPGSWFCAHVYHPDGVIPHEDNMLAQKFLLESPGGEEEFLAMANV